MSQMLLDMARTFFQSPDQKRPPSIVWQKDQMTMLRQFLRSLSGPERQSLYDTAQSAVEIADFRNGKAIPLWVFSHPCVGVFEEFLEADDVWDAFADYVAACSALRRDNGRARSRRMKNILRTTFGAGRKLPALYTALLANHKGGTYTYFSTQRVMHQRIIALHPVLYPDEEVVRQYCERLEKELNAKEIVKLVLSLKLPFEAMELVKIFSVDPAMFANKPNLEDLDLIAGLEITNFEPTLPVNFHPTSELESRLGLFAQGKWAKFSTTHYVAAGLNEERVHIRYTACKETADFVRELFFSKAYSLIKKIQSTEHGLLPVGLKLHYVGKESLGVNFLTKGYFTAHNAGACFNLPPVGSTAAARILLEHIEMRAGIALLDSPDFQIQVCSAGKLVGEEAALLGIGFYLSAQTIRRYDPREFRTTHEATTASRLLIAGAGVLDTNFPWWSRGVAGLKKVERLPMTRDRVDVLTCKSSFADVENINLIATLLVHNRYSGYWHTLGKRFVADMKRLLELHGLSSLLEAHWVSHNSDVAETKKFVEALTKLTNYAFAEAARVSEAAAHGDPSAYRSIFTEMHDLLDEYRGEIIFQASQVESDSDAYA